LALMQATDIFFANFRMTANTDFQNDLSIVHQVDPIRVAKHLDH
jgi:hypothetical protein